MYGGMDATGGALGNMATQLGLRAKIFAGAGVCTEQLPALAGNAAENVVCSQAGAALEKLAGGATFLAKCEKRFNQPSRF
ncbi:branched-chain amino acid ABC transporter substrate-binding protein, partial [Burkholderia pseudomallei]